QSGDSAPCTIPREWILCSAAPTSMAQRTASSAEIGPRASLWESNSPETASLPRKSSLASATSVAVSFRPWEFTGIIHIVHLNFIIRAPADNTPLVTTEVLGVLDAILPAPIGTYARAP